MADFRSANGRLLHLSSRCLSLTTTLLNMCSAAIAAIDQSTLHAILKYGCVQAYVRACERACVHASVRACMRVRVLLRA